MSWFVSCFVIIYTSRLLKSSLTHAKPALDYSGSVKRFYLLPSAQDLDLMVLPDGDIESMPQCADIFAALVLTLPLSCF